VRTYKVVGTELDEAALKYQRQHPEVSYEQALKAAMDESPDLAKEYVAEFGHVSKRTAKQYGIEPDYDNEDAGSVAAGNQLDRLALAYLADHPTQKDYKVALDIVMARHPDLKAQWLKKYDDVRHGKPWTSSSEFEDTLSEQDKKDAAAAADALVKKIQAEHPDWTIEQCLQEARDRLKKKGAKLAQFSEDVQIARNRARALLAS